MPRFGFAIDNRVCIGCHACTVACKSEHEVPLGVNRTWVKYIEKGAFPNARRSFSVQRCNHCADAPCVEICPVTSLYRRPDGIVDFDNDRCIGCTACMQACPYDALYLDPATSTAAKCNYCTHRVDAGYEPACVVVCPVEAIVSGDLDDPDSRIALLDRQQRVQYPKVEKGTDPKLFYVGGETAAMNPGLAGPRENYLWSGTPTSVSLPQMRKAADEAERARRVYDQKPKPGTWGWMVSAYVSTKAVATGLVLVPILAYAAAETGGAALPTGAMLLALLFLGITGGLLVGDLKQPRRFLYVLLRPQWKSWLVRGAYLITAFAPLVLLTWLLGSAGAGRGWQLALGVPTALLAGGVAVYTAFLFAQAKGRDYWQNPLLGVGMLADALVAGAAVVQLCGLTVALPDNALLTGAIVLAVLTALEFIPRHQTENAHVAAGLILRGPFAGWFWGGVVAVGLVLPLVVLLAGGPVVLAAIGLLVHIVAKNHVVVQAPQRVPLS